MHCAIKPHALLTLYRLMYRRCTAGTMEEMVYSRQIYKQQHSEMVLEGKTQPRVFEGGPALLALGHARRTASGGCI